MFFMGGGIIRGYRGAFLCRRADSHLSHDRAKTGFSSDTPPARRSINTARHAWI
jgi:hypothetical protein